MPSVAKGRGTPAVRTGTSVVDLLDRVVDTGVVVSGDFVISLADVDLIQLDQRLLLIGVDAATRVRGSI
jgi:hypothetical protein